MNVQQSVRQALAAGAIASSTVAEITRNASASDTRTLQILSNAVADGTISVVES